MEFSSRHIWPGTTTNYFACPITSIDTNHTNSPSADQLTMAILAASICSNLGKPLLSRLFRDLSKDRITALLANFPTLLASSESRNTTVEDENVRYVFQPIESCWLVLLTTKQSNILEDIETLQLFVSVTNHMLRVVDDRGVYENAFELLSAFDEIVTMGYKEKLSVLQVQTFLEMDSHEEKIQEIIEKNKEMEAAEERRRRAKEIQRKEFERRAMEQQQAALYGGSAAQQTRDTFNYTASQPSAPSYDVASTMPEPVAPEPVAPRPIGGKGLKLGKKPARLASHGELGQPLLSASPLLTTPKPQQPQHAPQPPTQQEESLQRIPQVTKSAVSAPLKAESASASPAPSSAANGALKLFNNGILITINEKITAHINHENGIVASEVKGDLNLRINNSVLARSKIMLNVNDSTNTQYKTHPNVDRNLFSSEGIIALKDKTKPFPSNDQSLGVLRWRATAKEGDSSLVPVLFTAWVSVADDQADVTLEYELSQEYLQAHPLQESFDNVSILVPISLEDIILKEDSTGLVLYEVLDAGVEFNIQQILLSNPLGSFEFSIPALTDEDLFPMEVNVDVSHNEATESDVTMSGLSVTDVVSNDEQENSLPFDLHINLVSENYLVA